MRQAEVAVHTSKESSLLNRLHKKLLQAFQFSARLGGLRLLMKATIVKGWLMKSW